MKNLFLILILSVIIFTPLSAAPESCTDFSGTWKGTCFTQSGSYEQKVVIQQEKCTKIEFKYEKNIEKYFMNQLNVVNELENTWHRTGIESLTWDQNQNGLELYATYAGKRPGSTELHHSIKKGSFKIQGNTLLTQVDADWEHQHTNHSTQAGTLSYSCELERKLNPE